MCVGENCAPQAVHYMNAQLTALYENALECIRTHDPSHKPEEQTKYSHALAEYSFADPISKGHQEMFQATFGQPHIDFICDHDTILRLRIINGYYRLDYTQASPISYPDKERLQSLTDVELTLRVGFTTRYLTGRDMKIGNGKNLIQLVVLDFLQPQLISTEPAVVIGREALVFYLNQYLAFLHQAGNHVLFSLPDFDDDRYRLTIDYSLMGAALYDVQYVHSVSVDKINTYLSSVWLKAAMLASGLDDTAGEKADWRSTCLAEYRSWEGPLEMEAHFHIKLSAPHIKAVCSREVILYFNIDEVLFYETADASSHPARSYTGWEIALLVNVIHEKDEREQIRCILDLSSVRVYHQHCKFVGLDETDEIAVTYWTHLVEFFSASYLLVLEKVDFHVIYHFDPRWPTHASPTGTIGDIGLFDDDGDDDADSPGGWTSTDGDGSKKFLRWKETITRCDMFGFDQIVAISQTSINAHFAALFKFGLTTRTKDYASALSKWNFEQYFSAAFKPLTIRLLSNDRAIVWVHLEHGELKMLKDRELWSESDTHSFDGWHLAFEVDLRKCAHSALDAHESWKNKYKETAIYKEHGDRDDRYIEHIILDLQCSEFLHEFSDFGGLFDVRDHRPIDKVQAMVHYIRHHYFPHLAHHGLHIIHSIPIWNPCHKVPSCALTATAFHVYCKLEVTRSNWAYVTQSSEPMIVVLGMTSSRPLPAARLQYTAAWIFRVSRDTVYNTVCVSRSIFMEDRLLNLLTRINAQTTIIPRFGEVDISNGHWNLRLTTWANHETRCNTVCNWAPVEGPNGAIQYQWQHRDGWKYEHAGSHEISGTYAVHSYTRNYVELPTAARSKAMEIKIGGETELHMSFSSSLQSGSAASTASWNAVISIQTDFDGLKIKVTGSLVPDITKTQIAGDVPAFMLEDPQAMLREHIPKAIDLSEVINELKAFEGVWQYGYPGALPHYLANPIFNIHGDVMFELRPHTLHQTMAGKVHGATTAVGIGRTPTRPALQPVHRPSFFQKGRSTARSALRADTASNGNFNGNGLLSATSSWAPSRNGSVAGSAAASVNGSPRFKNEEIINVGKTLYMPPTIAYNDDVDLRSELQLEEPAQAIKLELEGNGTAEPFSVHTVD